MNGATKAVLKAVLSFRRYQDGCYAVVVGDRRGPCGNSKNTAMERYIGSGLIAPADSGK